MFLVLVLQPTASPYNIAEKVKQANEDLFNDNPDLDNRKTKVKFKEDLVDYEPSLTEDDVNSIESDNTNDGIEYEEINDERIKNPLNDTSVINLNLYNAEQEVEEEIEEEEEAIDEEEEDLIDSLDSVVASEVTATLENFTLSSLNTNEADVEVINKNSKIVRRHKRNGLKKNINNSTVSSVDCKSHCIERIDFGLNLSINKLQIHEKPVHCPTLKLQRRKCCEENRITNPRSLPCYSGFRTEYGLTSLQLERREKRKEIIRQKAEKRQQLMDQYKERKKQQNEEVFCQWLREVSKRKKQKVNETRKVCRTKEPLSPSVMNLTTRSVGTSCKERPKTAGEFIPSHGIKHTKRPHTSPAKVYIEVPRNLLQHGINVGSLLITTSKNIESKQLHILTVS